MKKRKQKEIDILKLSFTDCTSFAVMKRLRLTRVATFDDHFAKAGLSLEKVGLARKSEEEEERSP